MEEKYMLRKVETMMCTNTQTQHHKKSITLRKQQVIVSCKSTYVIKWPKRFKRSDILSKHSRWISSAPLRPYRYNNIEVLLRY